MKSSDQVGITFINSVLGRGIFNNVINVQLGAFNFDANEEGKVSDELVVVCRLRMDEVCARSLRNSLDDLLVLIDKAKAESAAGTTGIAANGDASHMPDGKPN